MLVSSSFKNRRVSMTARERSYGSVMTGTDLLATVIAICGSVAFACR